MLSTRRQITKLDEKNKMKPPNLRDSCPYLPTSAGDHMTIDHKKAFSVVLFICLLFSILSVGMLSLSGEVGESIESASSEMSLMDEPPSNPEEMEGGAISLEFVLEAKFSETIYKGSLWDTVSIPGASYSSIAGQARLPFLVVPLELEGEIFDFEVQFSNPTYLEGISMVPSSGIRPIYDLPGVYEDEPVDDRYYATDMWDPPVDHELSKVGSKENPYGTSHLYSLYIFPFKYNPKTCEGVFYNEVLVNIEHENPQEQIRSWDGEHYDWADGWDEPGMYPYVIITQSQHINNLTPLAQWKTEKGLRTRIIDVEDIYDDPRFDGADQQEEIRNFIRWSHFNNRTEYVLLAGDWDQIPTRVNHDSQSNSPEDGTIPSDSYYACIDNDTTWNLDDDSRYGEIGDLDDILPEVYVGRIAINDQGKMASWVRNVLDYEKDPPSGDWATKCTLVADFGFSSGDCAQQSNYLRDTYLNTVYSSFDRLYDVGGDAQSSPTTISNSINAGAGLVVFTDHGDTTRWSGVYSNSNVNNLNNGGMRPMVFAMACLTGWFDDDSDGGNFGDCIGEAFTEKGDGGGIGYIGSARLAYGSVGSSYSYEASSTGFEEDFIRCLSEAITDPMENHIGRIFFNAKEDYSNSWSMYFSSTSSVAQKCWIETNLLGDPELPIWTKAPTSPTVEYETNLVDGKWILDIIVKDAQGNPVEDALICLTNEKGMYMVETTNGSGMIRIIFDTPPQGQINLVSTCPNFLPFEGDFIFNDIYGPKTTISIDPAEPDGNEGWYLTHPTIQLSTNPDNNLDGTAITHYRWGEGIFETYTGPFTAPEGVWNLTYYSVDPLSNSEVESTYQFRVDTTPPVVILNTTPYEPDGENLWFCSISHINLTSQVTADESNVSIEYHWDQKLYEDFTEPFEMLEGVHNLTYKGWDIAGNLANEVTVTLKRDTNPPLTYIDYDPPVPNGISGWYRTHPTITLVTEPNGTILYGWDQNHSLTNYSGPISAPEGNHSLYFHSKDQAGNHEEDRHYEFLVDSTPPTVDISAESTWPENDAGWYNSTVTVTLLSELNSTISYKWSTGAIYTEYDEPLNITDGTWTLYFRAKDKAGNSGDDRNQSFSIDTVSPLTQLTMSPSTPDGKDEWFITQPVITLSSQDGNISYQWDDGEVLPYEASLEAPDGTHTLRYRSEDLASNKEPWKELSLSVDSVLPIADLKIANDTIFVDENLILDASDSMDNLGIASYLFDFDDGKDTSWSKDEIIEYNYSLPGVYNVTLIVKDIAGAQSEPVSILITVTEQEEEEEVEEEEERPEEKKEDNQDDGLMGDLADPTICFALLLVIAIIIILAVALLLRNRRRASEHPPDHSYDEEGWDRGRSDDPYYESMEAESHQRGHGRGYDTYDYERGYGEYDGLHDEDYERKYDDAYVRSVDNRRTRRKRYGKRGRASEGLNDDEQRVFIEEDSRPRKEKRVTRKRVKERSEIYEVERNDFEPTDDHLWDDDDDIEPVPKDHDIDDRYDRDDDTQDWYEEDEEEWDEEEEEDWDDEDDDEDEDDGMEWV